MMKLISLCVIALLIINIESKVHFKETFDQDFEESWIVSNWKVDEGTNGKFVQTAGKFTSDESNKGIQTSEDYRFYGISSKIDESFSNEGEDLVLQYSVKHENNWDCGGMYIKLSPSTVNQEEYSGDSDYNIMFGPDKCGSTKKVHFIINYKGTNHLIKKDIAPETDKLTHVYTLILHPDNTYEIRIDGVKKESGSLYDDFDLLAPKQIEDPDVSKPEDWIDEPMMVDPEDVKPEGYDDIEKEIEDPSAEKPEDWDDEFDGEWEAPMLPNPEYKGAWSPKKIKNPDYKGPWKAPLIDNPEFVDDDKLYLFKDIGVVGFELWQVKAGAIFDNIFVGNDVEEAEEFLEETYTAIKDAEKEAFDAAQEEQRKQDEAAREAMEAKAKEDADEDEDDEDDLEDELEDKSEL